MMSSTRMATVADRGTRAHGEGITQVAQPRQPVQSVLLRGRTDAIQRIDGRQAHRARQLTRDELRLVVAARAAALEMHGHGHQRSRSRDGQQLGQVRGGGAGQDRRKAGRTGVLQRSERAADRALVGERRKRQRQGTRPSPRRRPAPGSDPRGVRRRRTDSGTDCRESRRNGRTRRRRAAGAGRAAPRSLHRGRTVITEGLPAAYRPGALVLA